MCALVSLPGFIHKHKDADTLYNETLNYLKLIQYLLTLNSDKGGVTVVTDKEEYKIKMNDILSDINCLSYLVVISHVWFRQKQILASPN